jgi:hypothetical protein
MFGFVEWIKLTYCEVLASFKVKYCQATTSGNTYTTEIGDVFQKYCVCKSSNDYCWGSNGSLLIVWNYRMD